MFLISYDLEPIFNKIGKYIQAQHYAAYSDFVLCFFLFLNKKRKTFKFYFIFVYGCLAYIHVYVTIVCILPVEARVWQTSETGVTEAMDSHVGSETKPRSSIRKPNAPTCQNIFLALFSFFKNWIKKDRKMIQGL